MLSFQRFVSLIEVDHPVYEYKDIYTFRNIYCVFRTNRQLHQTWVYQFFRYYYDHCQDHQDLLALYATEQYQIYSYVDEQTYQRLFEWIEEILLLRVGYFDDDIAEITFSDGGIVIDRQRKIVLCYDQSFQQIYFVSDGSDESVKFEITQTIREIFAWRLETKGYYLLQASAVAKDGKSIVFCGGSGTGKTTILLGLLERGYHLLSDDKVFIGVENRRLKTITWPGSIGVTLATTMHFDPLIGIYADLGSMSFPQRRIHSLALDHLEENEVDKIDLSVEETVSAFQTKFVREAELAQLFLIDDFLPYENFQPVQDSLQSIQFLKQHFCFPQDNLSTDSWSDPSFPAWFQARTQHTKQTLERYDLTLKILTNLPPVKKFNKARFQMVEAKIDFIEKHL